MDAPEKSVYTVFLIAAFVVGAIFLLWIISLIIHQRQLRKTYLERLMAEITATEIERSRIAADLHDELGPLLSAIKLMLNKLDTSAPLQLKTHDQIEQALDNTLKRLREIVKDLMPEILLRKGLKAAINEFTGHISNVHKINIHFHHATLPNLDPQFEINMFRIIQELVHNAIKHSQANQLQIELYTYNKQMIMHYEDDGIGFNFERELRNQNGFGLRNILSRTDMLNGTLSTDKETGTGAKLTINIPLP